MQSNVLTLRGVVVSKYGDMTKFARRLNWSGRKTRSIVSGKQIPNAREIEEMADALDITIPEDLKTIFFYQERPQNVDADTA